MHGLVERQGLEQERSWRVEPESHAIGATFVCCSLASETGLACVRAEVECGRASGTLRKSISGPQGPGTETMLVRREGVLHLTVKTSSPSPFAAENPEVCQLEPS